MVNTTNLGSGTLLIGVGVGIVAGLVMARMRQMPSWIIKVAAFAAVATLGGGFYLGWLRSQAGLSTGPLAHPGTFIEDARKAAADIERRNVEHLDALDQLADPKN